MSRTSSVTTYVLLRWLDDYTADLRGEYFPFDLPNLAFYRRGIQLGQLVGELVAHPDFPGQRLSTLETMARHLNFLRDDADIVAAAGRLEKAAALFQELRDVLRLSSHPRNRLLRGHAPSEAAASRESAEQLQQHLAAWRDRLARRRQGERDEHKHADQATVLKYLEKYEHQLVGHVTLADRSNDSPATANAAGRISHTHDEETNPRSKPAEDHQNDRQKPDQPHEETSPRGLRGCSKSPGFCCDRNKPGWWRVGRSPVLDLVFPERGSTNPGC